MAARIINIILTLINILAHLVRMRPLKASTTSTGKATNQIQANQITIARNRILRTLIHILTSPGDIVEAKAIQTLTMIEAYRIHTDCVLMTTFRLDTQVNAFVNILTSGIILAEAVYALTLKASLFINTERIWTTVVAQVRAFINVLAMADSASAIEAGPAGAIKAAGEIDAMGELRITVVLALARALVVVFALKSLDSCVVCYEARQALARVTAILVDALGIGAADQAVLFTFINVY
jgi:hypothetical protein